MTVAQNIAVVPRLLGWPRARIRARTDELLDLVALPPTQYRKRYPRQLSGGQQQRVGIARALAADPAVLLMDEPFGAIDAITRADLQNQLINIQKQVPKTVIFVTHDVEEALRLADRIVVMRDGGMVQYDTPFHLLTQPLDDFVSELLGADDVLRQLSLINVTAVMEPLNGWQPDGKLAVATTDDVRSALSRLIAHGASEAAVTGDDGTPVGRVTLQAVLREAAHPEEDPPPAARV
jgi:osmoprotectant transport system ATP-binding protein